jgi:hypothetical protein
MFCIARRIEKLLVWKLQGVQKSAVGEHIKVSVICWNDINREKYSEKYLLQWYFPTTNPACTSLKLNPILRMERQDINSLRYDTVWLQHYINIL